MSYPRAAKKMLPITCHGWVAVDGRGNIPYEYTRTHPELPGGFPVVWKIEASVPKAYTAQHVEVSIRLIRRSPDTAVTAAKQNALKLTGTDNSVPPDSKNENGGAK